MVVVLVMLLAGALTWLRGDAGVPQKNGTLISTWASSTFASNGLAAGTSSRPAVFVASASTPSFVRFDGVDDTINLDVSVASLQRPMTLCIVDRYTPGSTGPRQRNLQGSNTCVCLRLRQVVCLFVVDITGGAAACVHLRCSTTWVVGLDSGVRMFRFQGLTEINATTPAPAPDAWAVTCVTADKDETMGYINGELRMNSTASTVEPLALSLGGYAGPLGTRQVCVPPCCSTRSVSCTLILGACVRAGVRRGRG